MYKNYLNLIISYENSGIFLVGFDQLVQTTHIYKLPNYTLEHPPQSEKFT